MDVHIQPETECVFRIRYEPHGRESHIRVVAPISGAELPNQTDVYVWRVEVQVRPALAIWQCWQAEGRGTRTMRLAVPAPSRRAPMQVKGIVLTYEQGPAFAGTEGQAGPSGVGQNSDSDSPGPHHIHGPALGILPSGSSPPGSLAPGSSLGTPATKVRSVRGCGEGESVWAV